jgi:hypothetical protein
MTAITFWGGTPRRLLLTTLVLIGVGIVAIQGNGLPPAASWRQALDLGTGSTVLIGPVAAGLAAWHYARMRQASFAGFASATPKDLAAWFGPAALVWLQASTALLVATAVATGTTVLLGIPSHPGDLPILVQALVVLATYVGMGGCLGALTGQTWIAPLAVVLGYLFMFFSVWGLLPGTFDTGSASSSLVGNEFDFGVIALQGVVALGFGAACFLGVLAVLAARHWMLAGVLGVGLLAGAWSLHRLDSTGHERYAYADGPIPLTCAGTAPEVCVQRDAPRPLEALTREFAVQAAELEELGFDVPARFQVPEFFRRNSPGVGAIHLGDQEASKEVDPVLVSEALGTPGDCAEYYADRPDVDALDVHFLLQRWIADRLGSDRQNRHEDLGLWMHSDEGLRWALTVYPKLARCDFTGLTIPRVARDEG